MRYWWLKLSIRLKAVSGVNKFLIIWLTPLRILTFYIVWYTLNGIINTFIVQKFSVHDSLCPRYQMTGHNQSHNVTFHQTRICGDKHNSR